MIFGLGDRSAVPGGMGTLLFWFSWCCILAALALALRPWMQGQAVQARQRQHARTLLNLYSQNPCSYLALEDDKQLYFGKTVDGVVLPEGQRKSFRHRKNSTSKITSTAMVHSGMGRAVSPRSRCSTKTAMAAVWAARSRR